MSQSAEPVAVKNGRPARVVILQRMLPSYRVAFFRALRRVLAHHGIDLDLYYGQAYPNVETSTVHIEEPWAHHIQNRYIDVLGVPLVWQPCWHATRSADLVVVEQANRLLLNYRLLLKARKIRKTRIAVWGHGRNMQATSRYTPREILKRSVLTRADWCFAYTEGTAQSIALAGFPRERITAVENSIDTGELEESIGAVTGQQLAELRGQLGIGPVDPVAVFCGSMHRNKRLPFLLEVCDLIRTRIPNFHIVFVGDGPERHLVAAAARSRPWVHDIGSVRGPERAAYLGLGATMLMPGLVGLAVVDCFITRTPIITTDLPIHSPEFTYLVHGVNGLITRFDAQEYAQAVCRYLGDPALQDLLRRGCADAGRYYTLNRMVDNFATGVKACLAHYEGSFG